MFFYICPNSGFKIKSHNSDTSEFASICKRDNNFFLTEKDANVIKDRLIEQFPLILNRLLKRFTPENGDVYYYISIASQANLIIKTVYKNTDNDKIRVINKNAFATEKEAKKYLDEILNVLEQNL